MNKLLTTFFTLAVACATGLVNAQTAAAPASPAAANAKAAAPAPGSAKSIEAKTSACFGCHGIRGYHSSFPEVFKVPMISGQNAKYIVAALTAYKNGDRKHGSMHGMASSLSEQDMKEIAAFYESQGKEGAALPDKLSKQPGPDVAPLLQKAACVSCHGANLSKPIDPSYPKIAGQHADYLFAALRAYKTENSPSVGRKNPLMGSIAKQFSNAELKALAAYVSSLDSELTIRPESRFR
jgi:cytochrome c553